MIFLFDKFKKLKGTVRNRHTISLLYERERNGLYTVSAEIPLKITDKKTVYNYHKKVKDSDFLGHYDREGRFQLHKIASVDIEGSSIFIKGVHLFFDEAKAGAIIQERRFRNSEIIDGARVAFDSIGWSVVDFDVSDTKDYIFYNVSPLEARAILVETFGFEFDYWLDFDGKNIRNKQISVKREMGKDSNKRYNYGHNVLNIKVEQDYSEIYTAVIGRGKGEDLGDDAYGRRIEYTDVEWKTPSNPMNKPKGSRILHDENATQLFGYHEDGKVSPRTKVEIFEDIEEPEELLQATYEWLKENSVPKAVFSLEVPDGDGLDLGDKVHVIYRDIDLVKHTRVTRVVDDLVSGNRDVEFGDTAYFKTDRRLSGVKAQLKRVGGSMSSRISRLKAEFDKRFDDEVNQWKDDFEQAVIDAEAVVEVMRVTMTEEFEDAQREFEEEFNQSVADAKKHADDVADAKAKQVQDNLDSFAGRHEQLVEELQDGLVDIDGELADARADVLDIVGRLTVVDGNISGITDSLTEVEGTLSNAKTQLENQVSDARAELEQSISNTRAALEGKIESAEEALNKVGEDLGDAKTDLQKQLDEARAELEGLEVGGRNLVSLDDISKFGGIVIQDGYTFNVSSSASGGLKIDRSLFIPDTNYVFSYKIKVIDGIVYNLGGHSNGKSQIKMVLDGEQVYGNHVQGVAVELSEGWHTFEFHFYYSGAIVDHLYIQPNRSSYLEAYEVEIKDIQLEEGTIRTGWTPAPEDTEQKITNINQTITNIEGELSSKVEQTEVDALKGTVTSQGTLLSQTAEELSSKAEKSVVDTLTGRVTNAESSVTQNAAEIAKKLTKSVYDEDKKDTDAKITQWSNTASETAEGLSRVIGRVSETENGVETAQTRIEAEAGRIAGILSRTSEVEGKVQDAQLAIEANSDGLSLRATKTEVEQAIDGIEVGGRNLILDSRDIRIISNNSTVYPIETDNTGTNSKFRRILASNNILLSTYTPNFFTVDEKGVYTQSVKVKPDSDIFLRVASGKEVLCKAGEWTVLSFSFDLTAGEERRVWGINSSNNDFEDNNPWIEYKEWKVEKGTLATDWTPAPEDIDASISEVTDRVTTAEAEIVVQAGEISQKATQSELDRVTGRVSTAETSIIQNADEIARRLVKSDYDSDKQETDAEITKWSNLTTETAEGLEQTISRVSTAEGKLSDAELSIKTNADSLKLTATKTEVEQAIDGIEVGGRNLFSNSTTWDSPWDTGPNLIKNQEDAFGGNQGLLIKGSTSIFGYNYAQSNTEKWVLGNYIFSAWMKTTTPHSPRFGYRNGIGAIYGNIPLTTEWQKIEMPFTTTNETDTGRIIYFYPNADIYISHPKLEYGNKATDWTPAPEDTEAKISKAQADIKINADEIATKVSNSQFDSLSGKVSDNSSSITQNAKEIALKASQSELNSVTGRVSTAESQLSVQAGQIALRATKTEVESAIDGLDVGVRNLVIGSGESISSNAYLVGVYTMSEPWKVGQEYTVLIKGEVNDGQVFGIWAAGTSTQATTLKYDSEKDVHVSTFSIQRISFQRESEFRIYNVSSEGAESANVEWVMMVKGNKAPTSHVPAPEDIANRVTVTESSLTVLDDEISSVVGRVSDNETNITSIVQDVTSITSTVATLEGDVSTQGSQIKQATDSISSKVWLSDIASINPNLITYSDVIDSTSLSQWEPWGADYLEESYTDWLFVRNSNTDGNVVGIQSPRMQVYKGRTYTVSWESWVSSDSPYSANFTYMFITSDAFSNTGLGIPSKEKVGEFIGRPVYRYTLTFEAPWNSNTARILFGTRRVSGATGFGGFRFRYPKLEEGSSATPYTNAYANLEVKADEINQVVAELDGSVVKQSQVKVQSDRILIGSQSIGSSALASIIAVSPNSVDIITDAMNLTGNLNVKGQIEAISMSAISANFAEVQAAVLKSSVVKTTHLASESVTAAKIKVDSVLANKLIANSVMASEVKALSLDAVEANIGSIRSSILTSNVIMSDNLNASLALIDKIFSENMYVRRMTAKSAFISEIQAIEITANKINGGVLSSLDQNMTWDLVNNVQNHYVSNTIKFHAYGNATTMHKSNQTVGMAFLQSDGGLPRLVIGGNSSSSLAPNHAAWNGIDITPDKHEMNITADKVIISSEGGEGSQYLRSITIDLYRNDGQVFVTPLNQRGYYYHLGSASLPWRSVWATYINNIRFYENEYGIYIRSARSGHNTQLRISPDSVTVLDGSTVVARLWQR